MTKRNLAFTMAEILLSLTIIGVVAAITLPSLTGNINERTWNTQRKALYARFSQALALMPNLNGYGTLEEGDPNNVAETFVTSGLSKVMKINNICSSDSLEDCGIPSKIIPQNGGTALELASITTLVGLNEMFNGTYVSSYGEGADDDKTYTYEQLDTNAAAFETQNGESILVYYNPQCKHDTGVVRVGVWHYTQPYMCANFVYDLNGNKGPNTVGKDIGFVTAMYPTDPIIVAPVPLATNAKYNGSTWMAQTNAGAACKAQDDESRVPNRDELASMFYNRQLLGIMADNYWSGSVISSGEDGTAWYQGFNAGDRNPGTRSSSDDVRCVRRQVGAQMLNNT